MKRVVSAASQKNSRDTIRKHKLGKASAAVSSTQLPAAVQSWPAWRSYAILAGAVFLCLIPFSGKAFQVDDTLFIFTAKQIVQHPFDPYGFQVVWNASSERMSEVTKNPPLASYYAALIGRIAGWSERTLHLAFLVPALALVLGTYRLAQRLTHYPLLAALATLLTPGVLVSATSVMCDTMMIALWVWATILWVEGLEPQKPSFLLASSVFIAAATLTKYFGGALILLLLAYSVIRLRRLGWWTAYLLIPIAALIGYEFMTAGLYGHGLITDAFNYADSERESRQGAILTHALVSLSFAGGCGLSALPLIPVLWPRKLILIAASFSTFGALAIVFSWIDYGLRVGGRLPADSVSDWAPMVFQLALCIIAGCSIIAMAVDDIRSHRDAASWLLALWVLGTWVFAGFLNWTVNARSVLPLIPPAAILMMRRLDKLPPALNLRARAVVVASGLAVTGVVSLWITASDAAWANSARDAATKIYENTKSEPRPILFVGHWGFQYYMESFGFVPVDDTKTQFQPGEMLIVPSNNTTSASLPEHFGIVIQQKFEFLSKTHATTLNAPLGVGFYSSHFGPLPFAFGNVSPELYYVARIGIMPSDVK